MTSPIVIGGLGGSGTRIVASILSLNEVFLGNELNNSMDYLIFSRLFIRPMWLKSSSTIQIEKRLELFTKYTLGEELSQQELKLMIKLNISYPRFKSTEKKLLHQYSENKKRKISLWGWKEPNSHIYLNNLLRYYDNLKYIYVVRNGMDMLVSQNKQQLNNWGGYFEIEADNNMSEVHRQGMLWLKANDKVKDLFRTNANDKIFILDYDLLCTDTEAVLTELFSFLNFSVDKKAIDKSAALISPSSRNRYLEFPDIDIPNDLKTKILNYSF